MSFLSFISFPFFPDSIPFGLFSSLFTPCPSFPFISGFRSALGGVERGWERGGEGEERVEGGREGVKGEGVGGRLVGEAEREGVGVRVEGVSAEAGRVADEKVVCRG